MMTPQGVFVNGGSRPQTKAALKQAIKRNPDDVVVQQTSAYPESEFEGAVSGLLEGGSVTVIGPEPLYDSRWKATILRRGGELVVR